MLYLNHDDNTSFVFVISSNYIECIIIPVFLIKYFKQKLVQ